ncbi:GH3 auxin-responsive promoter family protein [Zhouia sp. PK063]|uniref:GH3 family domain-containing protein n=1 Tax=Zhouia sp. PK063 TaxID=3373602 RepID=UPI0037897AC2
MAVLGSIIKGLIDLKEAVTPEGKPMEQQQKVLKHLLEKAKQTAFGEHYCFSEILDADNISQAFAQNIPYFDYNSINEKWWYKWHEGEKNVTWPGIPSYYALSSGTTGKKSKRIPVSNEMIEAIKNAGITQISALANFDLPADFFEKEIMMLGSSTDLHQKDGHLEGEISGISASNIPFWFKGYYKPGEDIAKIDDWDERVQKIAENAHQWDIGALSGIPSWMELMIKKVIEYHEVKNIHEIWPNLQVYTSGGVAFEPYEKSFNALLSHPITVIDTYLASEGFIACQQRPDTNAMKLITGNGIYFEFVPFEPKYINEDGSIQQNAPVVTLENVEEEKEYILIISTISGLWRYLIGDTIKFTNKEKAEIRITGRTKFFLNVVGSQLSVNKMNDGVQELENQFDIEIPEFTLAAIKIENEYYHKWYLGTTSTNINNEELATALDNYLKSANKNYGVARSKALKGLQVVTVQPDVFHEWNDKNKKKGGQVKMERVMNEEKFTEWENFVQTQVH